MSRLNFLKRKSYWLTKVQIELYNELLDYVEANNLTQNDLAAKLGVSKSYISQLMNGNFDHKISKLIDIAFLMDKVPIINYPQLKNYIAREESGIPLPYKHYEYYKLKTPNEMIFGNRTKIDFSQKIDFSKNSLTIKKTSDKFEFV